MRQRTGNLNGSDHHSFTLPLLNDYSPLLAALLDMLVADLLSRVVEHMPTTSSPMPRRSNSLLFSP